MKKKKFALLLSVTQLINWYFPSLLRDLFKVAHINPIELLIELKRWQKI